MRATVEVPVESEDLFVRDGTQRSRVFLVDHVTINYSQEYTAADSPDENIGPWYATAVASGFIVTGGAPGKRRTDRTFHDDPTAAERDLPDWLAGVVDRFNPAKRA
jgi:hypothetical protein